MIDVYDSEGTGSPCESPVKNERYFPTKQSVISPGKLKQHVTAVSNTVFAQIENTVHAIEQNSPSKNSMIDRRMIQHLKDRRLKQLSQNRPDSRGNQAEDIINRIKSSIKSKVK